jgi:hypothetical protein
MRVRVELDEEAAEACVVLSVGEKEIGLWSADAMCAIVFGNLWVL